MDLALPDSVVSTLEEARQAYIAVPSQHGPHVTPDLYSWSRGRVWFAAASSTLKTKVLRREPFASALISVAGRSVALYGPIEVHDPRDPRRLVRSVCHFPETSRALASYTVRNAPDLVGFVRDAAVGRLGWRIPLRVLFELTPVAAAYLENDVVTGTWGTWTGAGAHEAGDVPVGGEPAVAAFPGPVAFPARWFAEQQVMWVAPDLLQLLDLVDELDVSVVVDDYGAPGPAAKRGVLVRGRGRVAADEPGFVEVDPDAATTWSGVETASASVE
jgi:hypothetical protein